MTIKEEPRGNGRAVKMTECAICGAPIEDNKGFAQHWREECENNPEA